MRRYFVQERGKKRRHSRATASIFNLPAGRQAKLLDERASRCGQFISLQPLNINPVTNEIDISFQPVKAAMPLLEDVFNLIEKLGTHAKTPVIVLDEFQDIFRIGKGLDRQLRAIIQHHKNVNYAFLGSMESMMRDIFEKKNSAFYHFGQLITLDKIPYDDFYNYLIKGFSDKCQNNNRLSVNMDYLHRVPFLVA